MDETTNPYAAPAYIEPLKGKLDESDAERIRLSHLKRESEIKSLGTVCIWGSACWAAAIPVVLGTSEISPFQKDATFALLLAFAYGLMAIMLFWLGSGLRQFNRASRWGCVVLAALFILHPLATIMSGYSLYVLLSPQAAMVFSPYYAQVRQETPNLQPRQRTIASVLGGITILVQVGIIAVIVVAQLFALEFI